MPEGMMMIKETEPARMTATEASSLIQARKLSCEELIRSCLGRIAARDAEVKAWLYLDPDYVIRRARELDKTPWKGPLHGLPWGVKDVIDTAEYQRPRTRRSMTGCAWAGMPRRYLWSVAPAR
jgi:Asp-tRNA(Asn)/Glu-tRNA(Gln) amidotransferase A subunit family amidase